MNSSNLRGGIRADDFFRVIVWCEYESILHLSSHDHGCYEADEVCPFRAPDSTKYETIQQEEGEYRVEGNHTLVGTRLSSECLL